MALAVIWRMRNPRAKDAMRRTPRTKDQYTATVIEQGHKTTKKAAEKVVERVGRSHVALPETLHVQVTPIKQAHATPETLAEDLHAMPTAVAAVADLQTKEVLTPEKKGACDPQREEQALGAVKSNDGTAYAPLFSGEWVRLAGFQRKPAYNGRSALVFGPPRESDGRIPVRLTCTVEAVGLASEIWVKRANCSSETMPRVRNPST